MIQQLSPRTGRFREKLIATGYSFYEARVLHAAFELGVFAALGRKSLAAESMAHRLRVDSRGMRLLLSALAGLGFIVKKGERFKNCPEMLELVRPDKEGYVGDMVELQSSSWAGWAELARIVKTGKPFRPPPFLADDRAVVRGFIRAMHNTAVGHARELAERIPLGGRRHLLDLGGGPGTFTVYFLKANPFLRGTVFDLPETLRVTKEIVRSYGFDGRVSLKSGDFLRDPIRGRFDVVFVSHIIHGLSGEDNRSLAQKIFSLLDPGGEILIQDFFLNADEASPTFPALFALNMLIHTERGRSYSFREAESWLREAGFRGIRRPPWKFARSIRVLRGVKPG